MSTDDGNIARLRVLVITWSVLLDSKLEFIVLAACSSSWIFANMRCGERVLLDLKQRHPIVTMMPGIYRR